ncbi:MAG: tRNA (adenosine(37)-N6)-threonylcarbamoyltransferase complex dimerization subunit type 1 TsaB [Planctomycetes bacterium]|nr:tRNA (adenosine(37)-N6)-threonylcarbamoyltransferase complex dimerization subunit type 1 TsaB [Planctomycetota bacterium]
MSVVLAIEVSQRVGGLALRGADGSIHVESIAEDRRHDDVLLPTVDRLFASAGLRPENLDAVGVSAGPGGFTGLRIAVSAAKMMALALGARVVAVPSALVVAESLDADAVTGDTILVALASKRDTCWATVLTHDGAHWRPRDLGRLVTAEAAPLDGVAAVLADRFLPEPIRARCAALPLDVLEPRLDPRACLAVTERMLGSGETTDPLELAPIYPRPPEAVTLWNARHARPSR